MVRIMLYTAFLLANWNEWQLNGEAMDLCEQEEKVLENIVTADEAFDIDRPIY